MKLTQDFAGLEEFGSNEDVFQSNFEEVFGTELYAKMVRLVAARIAAGHTVFLGNWLDCADDHKFDLEKDGDTFLQVIEEYFNVTFDDLPSAGVEWYNDNLTEAEAEAGVHLTEDDIDYVEAFSTYFWQPKYSREELLRDAIERQEAAADDED